MTELPAGMHENWHGVRGAMAALAHRAAGHHDAGAARLLARAAAWRAAFAAAPGERWALYLESTPEFAAALFGAWHAGKHVVLPGDTRPDTLQRLRAHCDGWAGDLPQALQPAPDTAGDAWPLLPADAAITLFTSGSTGAPEAIAKRLAQLDAETGALQAAFGAQLPHDVRLLTTVSHQHIYGLLFCVLWPLAAGRALPHARLAFHEEIVATCSASAAVPTALVTSPAHLRRMPEALDWAAARAVVRAVFSSGGPLPPAAADDALRHLGQSPIEVFGSSETGGIAWRQRARQQDRWTALPGVAWRLQDGFLAVRSAHLPAHLPDHGWHVCADLAHADGEHGFVLAGRADRVAKIEEKRVSLTAIEQALAASPLVQEARVVLIDLDVGARVAAAVVPSQAGAAMLAGSGQHRGRAALLAALKAAVAGKVDPLALPRRWHLAAGALPANTQGKTTEAMLRELFRQTLPRATWIERDAQRAAALLDVGEHLAIFDGHFPGTPIVPGVAQVDWVMALAPQRLPVPPRERFARLDVLKFQGIIRPGMQVRLDLDWQADKLVLAFRLSSAAGPHASGRIVFRSEHG